MPKPPKIHELRPGSLITWRNQYDEQILAEMEEILPTPENRDDARRVTMRIAGVHRVMTITQTEIDSLDIRCPVAP